MPLKVTHQGGESVVQDDATALIGSDASATIRIVRPGISRRHAVVSHDSSGWKVQDAGSRNGTFLDGRRVQVVSIEGPTTLYLGHPSDGESLSLVPTSPSSTATSPSSKAPTAPPVKASGSKSTEPLPVTSGPSADTGTAGGAATSAAPPSAPPAAAAAGAASRAVGPAATSAPVAGRSATSPRTSTSVQASDIEVAQLTAAIRDQISAIKGLTWSVWAMIAVTAALIVLTLFVGILST